MTQQPPVAPKIPTVRSHHGDEVVDDYEWLRAKDDPQVRAYLDAENAHTEARTAHLAGLRQALFDEIVARERTVPDQWQVQVQAKIQSRARVGVHSSYLSADDLRAAHLEPVPDLAEAVGRALDEAGPGARVCVLPEGPQTIPYLV